MNERVKYYPTDDFCCGRNLDKVETIYSTAPETLINDINDVLELYNIALYFRNNIKLSHWSDEEYDKYKECVGPFESSVKQYFNTLNDESILSTVISVESRYRDDFWELFEQCKMYNRISSNSFNEILSSDKVSVWEIFKQKQTIKKYGDIIREFLLVFYHSPQIIISSQELDRIGKKRYLPDCLSNDDIDGIFMGFIDREERDIGLLKRIEETGLRINPKTRLAAKRKHNSIVEELFADNSGIESKVQIRYEDRPDLAKVYEYEPFNTIITYDINWITDNLDYPTLLNNFIQLFDFADTQMRLQHVSLQSELGIVERTMFPAGPGCYPKGSAFTQKEMIASLQMKSYHNILSENGIRMESLIEWFFCTYLPAEFKAPEFRIPMPSEGTNYAEKCVLLSSAIDSVTRQFTVFGQEGELDFELLQLTSAGIKFGDIPSLLENKYAYGMGQDFQTTAFLLFSDQCMLSYVERIEKPYSTFIELLLDEDILLSAFDERSCRDIRWLESRGFLQIDESGIIAMKNETEVSIIAELYKFEVINVNRLGVDTINVIHSLHERGFIKYCNTLLSEPEVSLLNYYLNRAEFLNGLDLRNRYSHGVQQTSDNEYEHLNHYYILLRIIIMLIIKINDEFCLEEKLRKRKWND